MITYREFTPSGWDSRQNYLGNPLNDRQNWAVAPVGLNRDSCELEQSNFATFLDILGGESENVEIHRFGHWAIGWYEIILVNPHNQPAFFKARELESKLEDYPCLDEEDYSQREFVSINERWDNAGLSERVELLNGAGASIFAARRDSCWGIEAGCGDWPQSLIQP